LLSSIPSARLYDEAIKLFLSGYALQTFEMLRHYGLFQVLFPATEQSLAVEENGYPRQLLIKALENSDNRIADGQTVTAYFCLRHFYGSLCKRVLSIKCLEVFLNTLRIKMLLMK